MTVMKPWDRDDAETSEAFAAFVAFRDAGPSRTFRQAAEDSGFDAKTCERWRTIHNWKDRARAWDIYLDQQAQQAQVDAITKMKRRHVAIAMRLQQRAMEGLEVLDGTVIAPSDMARFASLGIQLERDARGDTEITPTIGVVTTDVEDVPKLVAALRRSVEDGIVVEDEQAYTEAYDFEDHVAGELTAGEDLA